MKLIDRQIKAVKRTLKQVIGEYKRKKSHAQMDCLLCKEFEERYLGGDNKCKMCPLVLLIDTPVACVHIAYWEYNTLGNVPLKDIAGFLKSLEIGLKEMR